MGRLRELTEKAVKAWDDGDKESYFALLSDDAVLFPPNEPPKTGNELRGWLGRFIDQNDTHFDRYRDEQMTQAGQWAINHYSYSWNVRPRAGGDAKVGEGHGIRILRRQADGSWRITREMWSMYPPVLVPQE